MKEDYEELNKQVELLRNDKNVVLQNKEKVSSKYASLKEDKKQFKKIKKEL